MDLTPLAWVQFILNVSKLFAFGLFVFVFSQSEKRVFSKVTGYALRIHFLVICAVVATRLVTTMLPKYADLAMMIDIASTFVTWFVSITVWRDAYRPPDHGR